MISSSTSDSDSPWVASCTSHQSLINYPEKIPAPGGPKIDQHRLWGVEDVVFEIAGRDRHWRYHRCFLSCLSCETRTTAGTGQAYERREARRSRLENRVVRVARTHKRELTALSPCSTPSSCRLLLS